MEERSLRNASDVMSRSVTTLPRDATLEEAVEALTSRGVSGAPVCDPQGRVVGIISKGDLAEACMGPRARPGARVGEVMSREVLAVTPDQDLRVVAERMVFEGVHRAVVLDDDGTVVGIVTPLDVLRAVVAGGALHVEVERSPSFPSWPKER